MALHDRNPQRTRFTSEGGLALRLINKTGGNTVRGTIVEIYDGAVDNAVETSEADDTHSVGVMYSNNTADGQPCWVVIEGRCQVLLKDGVAGVRGYWLGVSDTPGRANCKSDPADVTDHNREIGHCMEQRNSGTNVRVYGIIHFN